jgi:hypothetical protein
VKDGYLDLTLSLERLGGNLLWMVQPDKWDKVLESESLSVGGFLPRLLLDQIECEIKDDDGTTKVVPPALTDYLSKQSLEIYEAYRKPMETGGESKVACSA